MSTNSAPAGHQLIDEITHLASLASEPRAIDPMLDTLRIVTAKLGPHQTLADSDRVELERVRAQLEDYLLNRDPLRKFTPESLRQALADLSVETVHSHRTVALRHSLYTTWLVAATLAALVFALPLNLPLSLRAVVALPVFIIGLHLGSAWFYLSSLRTFQKELQLAYGFIVAGIIIIGFGALQFPITTIFNLAGEPIFRYGGTLPLFTVACFLFYIAMRLIAGRLQLRSHLTSLLFVLGTSALLAGVLVVLPHPSSPAHEALFDLSLVCDFLVALHCLYAGLLAHKIANATSVAYAGAIRFFSLAMFVTTANVVWYGACLYLFGEVTGTIFAVASAPHVFTEVMLLQSGYVFKQRVGA